MDSFSCHLPYTIFGRGKIRELGSIASRLGNKVFLAIDPFFEKTGLKQDIQKILSDAELEVSSFSDIQPNPDCKKVDEAALISRENNCDLLIAVGGGSALDFGKGVSVLSSNKGLCWQYTERSDHSVLRFENPPLPMIAIPTTAGTGSESTPFAVFNNRDIGEKSTIVNDSIFPKLSIVDPELTDSMPPRVTASTGFDAFAHALEAFISLNATPFSKMTGREAMTIIIDHLPRAVAHGKNRKSRDMLAWASYLAGSSIAKVGVTLPHALGQAVSGQCGAPHGESIAACMVSILQRSYIADTDCFSEITEIVNPETSKLSKRKKSEMLSELIDQFLTDIELKVKFGDFGMSNEHVRKVTEIALTGYYFDIQCHPKEFTEDEIAQLLRECL